MKNKPFQIFVASVLVILLVLLTDPLMLWMPETAVTAALLIAVVMLCIWVGLIIVDRADDERELLHRMEAGRFAYILGIITLTLGLLVQGFSHNIDIWIVVTLGIMVISRLGSRLHSDIHR